MGPSRMNEAAGSLGGSLRVGSHRTSKQKQLRVVPARVTNLHAQVGHFNTSAAASGWREGRRRCAPAFAPPASQNRQQKTRARRIACSSAWRCLEAKKRKKLPAHVHSPCAIASTPRRAIATQRQPSTKGRNGGSPRPSSRRE